MKYYLVYLLNYKDGDTVILKDSYQDRDDALKSLERTGVEYIKELQGKQQAEICKQDKTVDEILADTKLKEGMYLRKEDTSIILYEKITVFIAGALWGKSKSLQVNKIGKFFITEYNFDDSIFRCTCMTQRASVPKFVRPEATLSFVDELKSLVEKNDGKFNLRPVKARMTLPKEKKRLIKEFSEITNF